MNLVGVLADESKHENAILTQILLLEEREQLLVELLAIDAIHEFEVFLEEVDPVERQRVPEPNEQAVHGGDGHVDEPKPDEYEDLLVEEIDGQRALHHVVVDVVAEKANLKVTHGDARKSRRLVALFGRLKEQIGEDLDAEQTVVVAEELVEQEELHDDVADEEDFGEQVHDEQVVAASSTAHDTKESWRVRRDCPKAG